MYVPFFSTYSFDSSAPTVISHRVKTLLLQRTSGIYLPPTGAALLSSRIESMVSSHDQSSNFKGIANPTSTGGGGVDYERLVGAYYLAMTLLHAVPRGRDFGVTQE